MYDDNTAKAVQTQKATGTIEHLDGQQQNLDMLMAELDELEGALDAVSAPRPPASPTLAGPTISGVDGNTSPLNARIENHNARIDRAVIRVRGLRQGLRL